MYKAFAEFCGTWGQPHRRHSVGKDHSMIRLGLLDFAANRRRITTDGNVTLHKTQLIDSTGDAVPAPTAFLIEQDARVVIRTHFHVNSQFQVFALGGGTLGRRDVKPFTVQYVAPHTGYGPIVAGEAGIWYYTLRPSTPSGARYLPDQRGNLDMSRPKRQVTSAAHEPVSARTASRIDTVIEPQADGLAAWMVHIPPHRRIDAPAHAGGRGRYYLVAEGTFAVADKPLSRLSLAWASGEDELLPLNAGAEGASIIVMQFPGDAI
jgi:hypothetical protein